MMNWLVKVLSYTHNAALSYSFFITVQLNQTSCHVKMARILYSQSHISIFPEQLEHEVISHIRYGLKRTNQDSNKFVKNLK